MNLSRERWSARHRRGCRPYACGRWRNGQRAPRAGDGRECLTLQRGVLLNDEGDMLPDGFFRGVSKYPFRTLIPTRDGAIKALADNGIVRGGYNGSQQTCDFFCLLGLAHNRVATT